MKYGVCTWTFGEEKLESIADFLAEAGYDGLELLVNSSCYPPRLVNQIMGDHGLSILSLTPMNVDLPHPDPSIRTKAVDYYLHQLDFAAAVGKPVISCHGAVPRFRPITTIEEEYRYLVTGVQKIAERAASMDLYLAMEVLNRYETHLLNTAIQARTFISDVGLPNVGILLDTYHMNIEEADPMGALLDAGDRLFLYHVADSNRQGVGRGHIDFIAQARALRRIGYTGNVIVECNTGVPDPFTTTKVPEWRLQQQFVRESLQMLKAYSKVVR